MKFKKEYLRALVYGDLGKEEGEVIEDKIVDKRRWSLTHKMVFRGPDNKHYTTFYSSAATEMQEETPFEYEDDEIECDEVRQVERVVKVWEIIK